eukprot:CAMPEP_0176351756 /NCGR_PEP_ID=MMETSP0126-20121128/10483_1 /TAXON_ID=141414 ORGANISM="Strombidinopsis acuminatum, Strain SPMC142" /NCGR_SAMPLE_ID=MMETSP0126 /ASSEMBLY_ACC=CAM_ASM_000229 /LENGTH=38 /DNA_ID= /DNA_START= /DNA_END= /DNA_ORIENTATION=
MKKKNSNVQKKPLKAPRSNSKKLPTNDDFDSVSVMAVQ